MEVDNICNQSLETLKDYCEFISILPNYGGMPHNYDDFYQAFPECVSDMMHNPFQFALEMKMDIQQHSFCWSFEIDIESSWKYLAVRCEQRHQKHPSVSWKVIEILLVKIL